VGAGSISHPCRTAGQPKDRARSRGMQGCRVKAAVRAPLLSNCSFLIVKITPEENQGTWLIFQEENHQGEDDFDFYF